MVALPMVATSAAGRESGFEDERNQRAEHGEIDDVEEIAGGDERDHAPMQRRDFRVVERVADETFDGVAAWRRARCRCAKIQPP